MKKMLFLLGLFSFCSSLTSCDSLGTNSPKLVGFYIEGERVSITENSSVRNTIKYQNGNASSEQVKEETDVITQEMLANPQEKVIVTLQFINEERDTFLELVLNDSDYGDNQVYDHQSKERVVHSVETYELNNKWVSDVTLILPKGKSTNGERKIEIKEVCFLRESIRKELNADLKTNSKSKKLNITLTDKYIPTSRHIFEFEEVEDGLKITKANFDYFTPKTLYFPNEIDGKKVVSLTGEFYEKDSIDNVIIPSNIKEYDYTLIYGAVEGDIIVLSDDFKCSNKDLKYDINFVGGNTSLQSRYIVKEMDEKYYSYYNEGWNDIKSSFANFAIIEDIENFRDFIGH